VKAGKVAGGLAIVNPGKLPAEKRDSVCAQCHLPGAVRIGKLGERIYHPGESLFDSTAIFVRTEPGRVIPANGHFEQLAQSRCWRESQGKLWCATCHDPHGGKVQVEQRCIGCHACAKKLQNNCVTCHMPRAPAASVQHAAFTDHSIPRTPHAPASLPADAILSPFPGSAATDRELGLAYATLAIEDNNRAWGMRAVKLLEPATDPSAIDQLAQLYDRMGKEDAACEMYKRVVDADPTATGAAVNLGTCLAKQGKVEESVRLWKDALARNPGLESARFNLAVALYRMGRTAGARAVLDEALKLNPASKRARELLRAMN
jgi:Flp pilus assembly protein TadD